MAEIEIRLAIGRHSRFEIDIGLDGPAFFVLSARKCGSTLINNIAEALAKANRLRYVAVADQFFAENVRVTDYRRDPALLDLLRPGNVYGGFRDMPLAFLESELFLTSPKLLFVRDPRDALVSEFFSLAYSHPIPPPSAEGDDVTQLMQGQRAATLLAGIDASVIERGRMLAGTMLQYAPIVGLPSTVVLKYEDYIFRKGDLISLIARWFGWYVDDQLTRLILEWADVRPQREDPAAFIRRVTPGDHREKLRPATINTINATLRPAMELFGYPVES
jgi:Sulfotransferase domain